MSGVVQVTDDSCWIPAGWVFDNVLEAIALHIEGTQPVLAKQMLSARTTVSLGYLDLRSVSDQDLDCLCDAADAAVQKVVNGGPASFGDPAFYPGYVDRFRELQEMLHAALNERRSSEPRTE